MHTINLRLAAAILALASSSAIAADVGAGAIITDFKYELIDLDLTDNITPAITFTSNQIWQTAYSKESGTNSYEYGETSVIEADGAAKTSVSPTGVSAISHFVSGTDYPVAYTSLAHNYLSFNLTANTELRLSALGSVYVNEFWNDDSAASIKLQAVVGAFPVGPFGDSTYIQRQSLYQGARDVVFSGSVATGDKSEHGYIEIWADARSVWNAPPVPEPETYAMLLAGAVVVGGAARRRARKGA